MWPLLYNNFMSIVYWYDMIATIICIAIFVKRKYWKSTFAPLKNRTVSVMIYRCEQFFFKPKTDAHFHLFLAIISQQMFLTLRLLVKRLVTQCIEVFNSKFSLIPFNWESQSTRL